MASLILRLKRILVHLFAKHYHYIFFLGGGGGLENSFFMAETQNMLEMC